ncbi:MAG: hypothetical protein GYA17_10025, partial [Chloroflexi bacterium]|nr:hypothetical protein [Chloroflexota bacterium]
EWLLLWLANAVVAFVVIYIAYSSNQIQLTVMGFVGAVVGYPVLLHAKLFTFRGATPAEDKSVGFEFILQMADNLLQPGITQSLEEMSATLVKEWRAVPFVQLAPVAKDYVTSHSLPEGHPRTKDEIREWIDQLLADAQTNPGNADDNARALYTEMELIGGMRGIRWILQHSK